MTKLWKNQAFTISHAAEADFEGGLRGFFEYRKLGIRESTNGRFDAHVIRAVPGRHSEGQWHVHDLDFQMIYVLKGWVEFEYEAVGRQVMQAGTCALQPPGIRHREIRHSPDLELLEIVSPADFETAEA